MNLDGMNAESMKWLEMPEWAGCILSYPCLPLIALLSPGGNIQGLFLWLAWGHLLVRLQCKWWDWRVRKESLEVMVVLLQPPAAKFLADITDILQLLMCLCCVLLPRAMFFLSPQMEKNWAGKEGAVMRWSSRSLLAQPVLWLFRLPSVD